MTDWPKMESMVMVADGYFVSEEFRKLPESLRKDSFDRLKRTSVKVTGLELYDGHRVCYVSDGNILTFRIPIEFVEPVIINTTEDDGEPTSEENKSAKAVAVEEKTEILSFPFTDDSRMDDALLFFARNGYKAWVESRYKAILYKFGGKLNVEMPKGRT